VGGLIGHLGVHVKKIVVAIVKGDSDAFSKVFSWVLPVLHRHEREAQFVGQAPVDRSRAMSIPERPQRCLKGS